MQHVASFMEVWIEIQVCLYDFASYTSPPSRRCGLKCLEGVEYYFAWKLPPSRRRGLKLKYSTTLVQQLVASFSEAWIEISTK